MTCHLCNREAQYACDSCNQPVCRSDSVVTICNKAVTCCVCEKRETFDGLAKECV